MAVEIIKTIKPSGGDYTSLSAWEAAAQGNLVALDQIHTAECYAMSDTTPCTIDGSTTDATRYLRVYTPASERHDGKWNATKYRLEPTDANALTLSDDHIRLEGLQVTVVNPTVDRVEIQFSFIASTSDIRISETIVKGSGIHSEGLGLATSSAGNVKLSNVLVYDCTRSFFGGIRYAGAGTTLYVYNCSIIDCYYGVVRSNGTVIVKNTLAKGALNLNYSGPFGAWSNYNASSDATNTGGANDRINQTFTFVNAAGKDFHLAATDAGAKDFGADLSGDADYPITTDIDGSTRVVPWDIGADEYVVAGTTVNLVDSAFSGDAMTTSAGVTVADASYAQESLTSSVQALLIDAAWAGENIVTSASVPLLESAGGSENIQLYVNITAQDSVGGSEALQVSMINPVNLMEQGFAGEALASLVQVLLSESALGSELLSLGVSLQIIEDGAGNEGLLISLPVNIYDSAAGMDSVTAALAALLGALSEDLGIKFVSVRRSTVSRSIERGTESRTIKREIKQ